MTVAVPPAVPLEMPPGDPEALEELVRDVAGAAFRLAVLRDELAGPAASAPGWLGDDAAAAVARVVVVADLARDSAGAVLAAANRLRTHRECLHEARRKVVALREEQDEDHRAAYRRLLALEDMVAAMRLDAAAAASVVEDFEATEAARRRRHTQLLEDLAEDAAATARVLASSSAVVGGTGQSGDAGRMVAYLAAQLPGWGDAELARRGSELARALQGSVDTEDWNDLARNATAYAGSAAFAQSLLVGLGADGMRELLGVLGDGTLGADSAVARLVAGVLGGAARTGDAADPVDAVLDATYVGIGQQDARVAVDPGADPDVVALGMGAVLAATAGMRSGGLRPETVGAWGRQILAREHASNGWRAVDRAVPRDLRVAPIDPVPLVVELLADGRDPVAAATFLGGRHVWSALLARSWEGASSVLGRLVERVAAAPGPAGAAAVQSGLAALGSGLTDGDPEDWTVDRRTAADAAPALGSAVAGHVAVAVEALQGAVDGRSGCDTDVLRGLGYLSLDAGAAADVTKALYDWIRAQPVAFDGTDPASPLPAVAVPSAYVAVREYGQRLAFALDEFEQQETAEDRKRWWDHTAGLVGLAPGPWGVGLGLVEGYVAIALGMDGTWDAGVDTGLSFDDEDAVTAVPADLPPDRMADAPAWADQARSSFARVADALGLPEPPVSAEADYLDPLRDMALDSAGSRVARLSHGVIGPSSPVR
jgi:hypothetical protein